MLPWMNANWTRPPFVFRFVPEPMKEHLSLSNRRYFLVICFLSVWRWFLCIFLKYMTGSYRTTTTRIRQSGYSFADHFRLWRLFALALKHSVNISSDATSFSASLVKLNSAAKLNASLRLLRLFFINTLYLLNRGKPFVHLPFCVCVSVKSICYIYLY